MVEIFVSYSRSDGDFVNRLCDSLRAQDRDVWLDTAALSDAEVFPEAIRRAIESCEAFLFVITPAAVSSNYCEQEAEYARTLGKRIVPVVRESVPDADVPEAIRERNWIPFVDDAEFDRSVERVIAAVDTDLEYRTEHTRWLVKAIEWDREHRDHSFLLRGNELDGAETWLAGAAADADPPPTELQRNYLLASRQANLRRQRRLAVGGVGVAAVSIALLVFALVARSQAVSAESTASSRALAAQSENLLSSDPESSMLIAMNALHTSATPDAMYAMREALDDSNVRLALPSVPYAGCYPAALYDPHRSEILRITGTSLTGYSAATAHVLWHEKFNGSPNCLLAVDPSRDVAVVSLGSQLEMVDPANGATVGKLPPAAVSAGSTASDLAFSPDGNHLAAIVGSGVQVWSMATLQTSVVPILNASSVAFSSDGTELYVGTSQGTVVVANVEGGAVQRTVQAGGPSDTVTVGAAPTGTTVALADFVPSGEPTTITLWDSATWTEVAPLTSVGPIGVAQLVFSPDGQRLAYGLADGSGSLWSVPLRRQLLSFLGQTSTIVSLSFDGAAQRVLLSGADGSTRAYQATGPGLAAIQFGGGFYPLLGSLAPHQVSVLLEPNSGNGCVPVCTWETLTSPGGVVTSSRVIGTGANTFVAASGPVAAVATLVTGDQWNVTVRSMPTMHVLRSFTDVPLGPVALVTQSNIGLTDNGKRLELGLEGHIVNRTATLRTYDIPSGKVVASRPFRLPTTTCGISGSASSSAGTVYSVSDFCGHLWLVDLASHAAVLALDTGGRESAMAFNPSGTRIAVASWDGITTVLDTRSGARLFQLVANREGTTDVSYTPDGRYIVTTSANGDVQTWSSADGQLLQTQGDPYDPSAIGFLATGDIVTVDADLTLRTWNLCADCQDPNGLLRLGARAVVTPLTATEQQQQARP